MISQNKKKFLIIIKDTCIALILVWALSALHSHTTGCATWVTLESRLHNSSADQSFPVSFSRASFSNHLFFIHISHFFCPLSFISRSKCMLVSVCFHNLVTYAQRLQDLYSACLMFWMRTHTGPRFIVSSEGRESHQPQVFRASHTNSKILVPDGARTPNLSHWSRTRYHCATGCRVFMENVS